MRIFGFMMVTSWCRRSGWESNSSGASFFITASSFSAAEAGTPYQVLGSPLENRGTQIYFFFQNEMKNSLFECNTSPVQEINRVTPVVLDVPAERGKTHPHVEPGYLHAWYVHVDVSEDGLLQNRQVVQVPARVGVFLTGEDRSALGQHNQRRTNLSFGAFFSKSPLTSSSPRSLLLPSFTGKPLPTSLELMSAPYSTMTSSSMLLTRRQNSFSTSSVGTIFEGKKKCQPH